MPRTAIHDYAALTDVQEPMPGRYRWTRRAVQAIRDSELGWTLPERFELVDGEIINRMGQNPPHAVAIGLLADWLAGVFGRGYVREEKPIDVSATSPEYDDPLPDVAVTTEPRLAYRGAHPGPTDLRLVAEVSDTSLRQDRTRKALLYARAGIADYWVVDLTGRQLFIHRHPTDAGYAEVTAYAPGETVTLLARPEDGVNVALLLPPQ